MSNQLFKFKQFDIQQDRCAMKIGTDSVLLGAWARVNENTGSILDIGSGTGILALMLAQRSNAFNIEAIEIDADAYEQCCENFENSQWADRLFCYHAALLEFVEEIEDSYDLIICNPPFYSEDYKTKIESRDLARFSDAMPFDHLIFAVSKLLAKDGFFSLILPYKEESQFIELASNAGLFPQRILHVKGNPNSNLKRSLIEFSRSENKTDTSNLIIETDRHQYTEDYVCLTKDFYLKM